MAARQRVAVSVDLGGGDDPGLPSDDELDALAQVAADGVVPDGAVYFPQPWASAPPAERARSVAQNHWWARGDWTRENWRLLLAVFRNGQVIGQQNLSVRDFATTGEARTGFWLGRCFQGQGCGTKGLTPHGLRHTHRTVMEDLGTEKVLMGERMGHIDGSVSARYARVTPGMRKRLILGLTEQWEAALDGGTATSVKPGRESGRRAGARSPPGIHTVAGTAASRTRRRPSCGPSGPETAWTRHFPLC